MNTNQREWLEEFIKEFVVKERQQRLMFLLTNPKRQDEFIRQFHDSRYFDDRFLHDILPDKQSHDRIHSLLREKGALEHCFAVSALPSLKNESQIVLKNALMECVGMTTETILYCCKAKIGYWEGGHTKFRGIFYKK